MKLRPRPLGRHGHGHGHGHRHRHRHRDFDRDRRAPRQRDLRLTFDRILGASLGIFRPCALLAISASATLTVACATNSSSKSDAGAPSTASTGPPPDPTPHDACTPVATRLITPHYDGSADLYYFESFHCGVPPSVEPLDGSCSFSAGSCQKVCPEYGDCSCLALDGGCATGNLIRNEPTTIKCDLDCFGSIGRRPSGYVQPPCPGVLASLGAYFARAAHLEAASVVAFEDLRLRLRSFGAPASLARRARAAAADERRHARTTIRLAKRFGGECERVKSSGAPPRSLAALAVDNAVEGCVRETYGALVASFQARRADDPEIRTAMRRIARDETRHAELAWAIFDWSLPRLTRVERRRVNAAFRRSVADLGRDAADPSPELSKVLGLPNGAEQRTLIDGLRSNLWAPLLAIPESPV